MIFSWFIPYLFVRNEGLPGNYQNSFERHLNPMGNSQWNPYREPGRLLRHCFTKRQTGMIHRSWISVLLVPVLLAGCTGTPIVGLHPEYPPVKIKTFSLYGEYVEVGSLQPTFRWQPFPFPLEERTVEDSASYGKIENLTYEIRIWKTTAGRSGKLVYVRRGLIEAYHRLETPLEPGTRYLWSVRAHFSLDGRPRTIEWTMAGYPLRNEAVPNESCLRFQTPQMQVQ